MLEMILGGTQEEKGEDFRFVEEDHSFNSRSLMSCLSPGVETHWL